MKRNIPVGTNARFRAVRSTGRALFSLTVCLSVWAGSLHYARAAVTKVACVGDSITAGYGLKHPKVEAYPQVLSRMLDSGWDVRNFGVSATTLLYHANFPYITTKTYKQALKFKANIVVIALGTNDSKHPGDGSLDAKNAVNNWKLKPQFAGDYKTLIASFRKDNPNVKIYLCLPPPDFPGRWGINGRTIHDEMDPIIRQVAKDEGAQIIDLYTPFVGKKVLFDADTVHPNKDGAILLAGVVYKALTGHPVTAAAMQRAHAGEAMPAGKN